MAIETTGAGLVMVGALVIAVDLLVQAGRRVGSTSVWDSALWKQGGAGAIGAYVVAVGSGVISYSSAAVFEWSRSEFGVLRWAAERPIVLFTISAAFVGAVALFAAEAILVGPHGIRTKTPAAAQRKVTGGSV